jgi:hypothetical protein
LIQVALGFTIHAGWPLVRWFGCFVPSHPIEPGSANPLSNQALAHVSGGALPKVSAIRVRTQLFAPG